MLSVTTLISVASIALAACGDGSSQGRTPGAAASRNRADSSARPPVRVTGERRWDVTGDRVSEHIVVAAIGPSYDSLTVRLEVQSNDGTPLYTDQWSSQRYFRYVPRAEASDSAVARLVRARLRQLLADSAFTPARSSSPRARIDTAAVAYALAEITTRTANHLPDSVPIPPRLQRAVLAANVPRSRVDSVITAIRNRPRYTYSTGGEVTYTIAWYPRFARFIRTQSCC